MSDALNVNLATLLEAAKNVQDAYFAAKSAARNYETGMNCGGAVSINIHTVLLNHPQGGMSNVEYHAHLMKAPDAKVYAQVVVRCFPLALAVKRFASCMDRVDPKIVPEEYLQWWIASKPVFQHWIDKYDMDEIQGLPTTTGFRPFMKNLAAQRLSLPPFSDAYMRLQGIEPLPVSMRDGANIKPPQIQDPVLRQETMEMLRKLPAPPVEKFAYSRPAGFTGSDVPGGSISYKSALQGAVRRIAAANQNADMAAIQYQSRWGYNSIKNGLTTIEKNYPQKSMTNVQYDAYLKKETANVTPVYNYFVPVYYELASAVQSFVKYMNDKGQLYAPVCFYEWWITVDGPVNDWLKNHSMDDDSGLPTTEAFTPFLTDLMNAPYSRSSEKTIYDTFNEMSTKLNCKSTQTAKTHPSVSHLGSALPSTSASKLIAGPPCNPPPYPNSPCKTLCTTNPLSPSQDCNTAIMQALNDLESANEALCALSPTLNGMQKKCQDFYDDWYTFLITTYTDPSVKDQDQHCRSNPKYGKFYATMFDPYLKMLRAQRTICYCMQNDPVSAPTQLLDLWMNDKLHDYLVATSEILPINLDTGSCVSSKDGNTFVYYVNLLAQKWSNDGEYTHTTCQWNCLIYEAGTGNTSKVKCPCSTTPSPNPPCPSSVTLNGSTGATLDGATGASTSTPPGSISVSPRNTFSPPYDTICKTSPLSPGQDCTTAILQAVNDLEDANQQLCALTPVIRAMNQKCPQFYGDWYSFTMKTYMDTSITNQDQHCRSDPQFGKFYAMVFDPYLKMLKSHRTICYCLQNEPISAPTNLLDLWMNDRLHDYFVATAQILPIDLDTGSCATSKDGETLVFYVDTLLARWSSDGQYTHSTCEWNCLIYEKATGNTSKVKCPCSTTPAPNPPCPGSQDGLLR